MLLHLDLRTLDPLKPTDPKDLVYAYGQDKLGRALQKYTIATFKETAANVQAAHPGTMPASKASKQVLNDYIVRYSTGT